MRKGWLSLILITILTICATFSTFAETPTENSGITKEKSVVSDNSERYARVQYKGHSVGRRIGVSCDSYMTPSVADGVKALAKANNDPVNLMMYYDSEWLYINKPDYNSVVYQGSQLYISFNIRSIFVNCNTVPVIYIYNSKNEVVYAGRFTQVPDGYNYTNYAGYLSDFNTSAIPEDKYSMYIYGVPCNENGVPFDDWMTFDIPYDHTVFEVLSTSPSISSATVSLSYTKKAYTGSALKPTVTVKRGSRTLVKNTDYKVVYSNNKSVGTATVTITGIGNYTGSKRVKFTIVPQSTSLTKLTSYSKGEISLAWKRVSVQTTGYQIQYGKHSDWTNSKTIYLKKNTITNTDIAGLRSKNNYYARIRCYKTVDGKKYYSKWSTVKRYMTK